MTQKYDESKNIQLIADEVLWSLNKISNTPFSTQLSICQKITLKDITAVGLQKTSKEFFFKLRLEINESSSVVFEALVLLSKEKLKTRLRDGFGRWPYFYNGKKNLKIMYVKRLDAYAGLCKDLSLLKNMDPMFCVCKDIEEIKNIDSITVEKIYNSHKMILIEDQTCDQACSAIGMDCSTFAQPLYKNCNSIPEVICENCFYTEGDPVFDTNKCFINPNHQISCTTINPNPSPCYCKKV